MSEIKSLMDMLNDIEESSELMEVSDTFTFELGEEGDECLVETGVVACDDETVIVEADEQTLQILSEHFIIEDFEEMDEGNGTDEWDCSASKVDSFSKIEGSNEIASFFID